MNTDVDSFFTEDARRYIAIYIKAGQPPSWCTDFSKLFHTCISTSVVHGINSFFWQRLQRAPSNRDIRFAGDSDNFRIMPLLADALITFLRQHDV